MYGCYETLQPPKGLNLLLSNTIFMFFNVVLNQGYLIPDQTPSSLAAQPQWYRVNFHHTNTVIKLYCMFRVNGKVPSVLTGLFSFRGKAVIFVRLKENFLLFIAVVGIDFLFYFG